MKKIVFVLVLLFFTMTLTVNAQLKTANRLYSQFKYTKAIPYYFKSVKSKKKEKRKIATEKLADCFRLTNQFEQSINWYEKVLEFEDINSMVYYNYATVLRTQGLYKNAKENFKKYLVINPKDERAIKYEEFCDKISPWLNLNASAQIKNFSTINSPFAEFSPTYYKDGIVFTSDRDVDLIENHNYMWTGNGYLNLYYAKRRKNQDLEKYDQPVRMSNKINHEYHDGPACFSADESIMYTTRTYKEKIRRKDSVQVHYSKIYFGNIEDEKPIFKAFKYNNLNFSIGHPTLSKDGNILIFSSDMSGGNGESDLYFCTKNDGEWESPQNLGAIINTFGNEYFPYLANDSTLYFASEGHMGYGGLDIYVTYYKNGKWQKPNNLMAPINSSYDDFGIILNEDMESGYFSSNRPGGKGSDDIYSFFAFKPIMLP